DGAQGHAIGGVDAMTGSLETWAATVIPSCSRVHAIALDQGNAYIGAEGIGTGCFDGTFAATVDTGTLLWQDFCLGATQSLAVIEPYLYVGSHAHDCAMVPGGFQETGLDANTNHHLMAEYLSDGHLAGAWLPNTDAIQVGPRAMATDGQAIWVGGDFTRINK